MYVRVNRITGAKNIDAGIDLIKEKVIPELEQQHGYRGLTASGNRSTGEAVVLTLWDTLADLEASESVASKSRQEAVGVIGGQVDVRICDQVATSMARVPTPGCALRVREVTMAPASIDENIAYFTEQVLPRIESLPGFCAVRNLMDRTTGRGMVGIVYQDEASAAKGDEMGEQRRADAAAHGVTFGELRKLTVLHVDLR